MGMVDHQFDIHGPQLLDGGWGYDVVGTQRWGHGPFPTEAEAVSDLDRRFRRWCKRARAMGGWAWRRTARSWVITAPQGVPVPGVPMQRAPCTRHQAA